MPNNAETLVRLIRHGIEVLRDSGGNGMTAWATMANVNRLYALYEAQTENYREENEARAAAEAERDKLLGGYGELREENTRLRELYENVTGNRERFGWTINHLLECDEALRVAQADAAELREAIGKAAYALDPNQGERPSLVLALRWLRTTFPEDHPNYVDPTTMEEGAPEQESAEWTTLLTIPEGWRPALKTFYADGLMGEPPRNQHSVDINGVVRIHPDAGPLMVKWALHHNLGVPKEMLGI